MTRSAAIVAHEDVIAEAIRWRRRLHAMPELAYRETATADFIAQRLAEFGLVVHRGLGKTGVVGTLTRGTSRRVIGIRADMDALPIEEQSGVTHASQTPGVMHACGHDGHVAMLLAAARICAQTPELEGTVHFIFQPAEESESGGRRMVEDGLFRLFPCDSVYALHNWPALPLGALAALDGPMMAALAIFEITIQGRGGHGAMPHESVDCVLAGCQLVSALQSIVSRNVDPGEAAVVSATQVHAGDTWNVIPSRCVIRGTCRWFDPAVGDLIERRIAELATTIASGFGCSARTHYDRRFPATINDPRAARLVRDVAESVALQVVAAKPSTGSEDFAFMLNAIPGCYFWLGAAGPGHRDPLHSSHYDFNDDLLPIGVAFWISLVQQCLTSVGHSIPGQSRTSTGSHQRRS